MRVQVFLLFIFLIISENIHYGQETSGEVTIGMTNGLTFDPEEITIETGQTITWKNSSDLVHTVTFDPSEAADKSNVKLPGGVQAFGSGKLKPGDIFSHTFHEAGNYRYFCIPHENAGMIGEITVKPAIGN